MGGGGWWADGCGGGRAVVGGVRTVTGGGAGVVGGVGVGTRLPSELGEVPEHLELLRGVFADNGRVVKSSGSLEM